MPARASIRDVAALAGISVSTVSNLLNGRPNRKRSDTVLRIEEAIERLGYKPNRSARSLKTGFTPAIGLLVPSVANPFHGAMAHAVEVAAQARGFQIVLGNTLRDAARERQCAGDFFAFGVRGVIATSSPFDLEHFKDLIGRGLSVVALDMVNSNADAKLAMDSVSMDNYRAGYLATQHLIDLGHRRIGYVSGATPTMSRRDRLNGYKAALLAAKIKPDPVLIAAGESASGYDDIHAAEHGRSATLSLLTLPDPPSALVALKHMHAVGACAAVREIGCTVPNHVPVVGIDDINLAALLYPPLTTVRHPVKPLSDAAVDLLVKRIEGQERGPSRQIVFEPTLVVRGSTAPCAKTKANLGKSQLTRSAVNVWGNSRA
jgi:DNA-binding LacI/PurR family transcriptional regulator